MSGSRQNEFSLKLNTSTASPFAPNYFHQQTSTLRLSDPPCFFSRPPLDLSFKSTSLATQAFVPLQLPTFTLQGSDNFTFESKSLNLRVLTFDTLQLPKFELPHQTLTLNSIQSNLPSLSVPPLNLSLATHSLQTATLQYGDSLTQALLRNRNQYNAAAINGLKQGAEDFYHTLTHFDEVVSSTASLIADTAVLSAVASRHSILSCNNSMECSVASIGKFIATEKPELYLASKTRMFQRADALAQFNQAFDEGSGPKKVEMAIAFSLGIAPLKVLKLTKPLQALEGWSKKSRLKAANLPTQGLMRYVPDKCYDPANPLPRTHGRGGYIDRFDNVWLKGPARGEQAGFEWDVQLSKRGKKMLEWTNPGDYINVSTKGEITHGLPKLSMQKSSMLSFIGVFFPTVQSNITNDATEKSSLQDAPLDSYNNSQRTPSN